jgi:CheY-like chemotaxis protein
MKKHILIIEDDPFLGEILLQKLRHEEFEATLVADGAQGLQQISALKPDLVLLDIILPSMNGYEVLEARQKDPAISKIPVIIISNSGQPVEIQRALALGISDYLVKAQMDPEDVLSKVRSFFQGIGIVSNDSSAPTARLEGKKILWVEDDAFLSDLVVAKLKHQGCTAFYAKDGEQALEMLKTTMPDVILLDLVLPGMSGFDVLSVVKSDPAYKNVPVIILSNLGQEKDVEKSIKLGAAKHLIKAEHDLDDIIGEILATLNK